MTIPAGPVLPAGDLARAARAAGEEIGTRRGFPSRTPANARTMDVFAGRMAVVSDEGTTGTGSGPDAASLAAHWYAKASERASRAGAPAHLVADVAELRGLTSRIEALTAQSVPEPQPDGSGIALRYQRGADLLDLTASVAQIMTRVVEDPEAAALWQRIADEQRQSAASARHAAEIISRAEII